MLVKRTDQKVRRDLTGPATAILMVMFFLLTLFVVLHQQYDEGYANGRIDGMDQGDTQGQYEAILNLQQWEYSHKCTESGGYISLKVVRDAQGKASYACEVKP